MPRDATGVVAGANFVFPCRLYAMTPACALTRPIFERHYRSQLCNASCSMLQLLLVCITPRNISRKCPLDSLLA